MRAIRYPKSITCPLSIVHCPIAIIHVRAHVNVDVHVHVHVAWTWKWTRTQHGHGHGHGDGNGHSKIPDFGSDIGKKLLLISNVMSDSALFNLLSGLVRNWSPQISDSVPTYMTGTYCRSVPGTCFQLVQGGRTWPEWPPRQVGTCAH